VCAGEVFEDLVFHGLPRLPRPGEELRTREFACTPGGGTLITAVAAARSGTAVGVVSALGPAGAARLAAESIRVVNLRRADEPHAVSVALSTRRDRAFVTFEGVNEVLEERLLSSWSRRLPRTRHLHLALGPRDLAAWIELLDRCRRSGVTTSWDFGWHADLGDRRGFLDLIGALDWVFVNEREARHYAGAATLARALGRWKRLARGTVIKQGRRGATVIAGGQVLRAPALEVAVVDTTGAGDAFNGGFLAAMLEGKDLTGCLRAGVRMGSLSTRAAGGLEGLPSGLRG
jgi:sugar/nucleoside kinase (ribokinase family)